MLVQGLTDMVSALLPPVASLPVASSTMRACSGMSAASVRKSAARKAGRPSSGASQAYYRIYMRLLQKSKILDACAAAAGRLMLLQKFANAVRSPAIDCVANAV